MVFISKTAPDAIKLLFEISQRRDFKRWTITVDDDTGELHAIIMEFSDDSQAAIVIVDEY